jgi:glycosyltransferase involved in cell wall biosynthesis
VRTIIVLGRDMRALLGRKLGSRQDRVAVIANWGDVDSVRPAPRANNRLIQQHGLAEKFVVLYAGNLGRSHDIESLLECATLLRREVEIHFLVIGSGAKKTWLQRTVRERRLTNMTILEHRPRCEQIEFLNACDVSIITFVAGMAGVSVPSRMYNVLAAGKPIIAMADRESELALVVNEERVGWVIAPGRVLDLASAIREARDAPQRVKAMGLRARSVVEQKYTLRHTIDGFKRALDGRPRRVCEPELLRRAS